MKTLLKKINQISSFALRSIPGTANKEFIIFTLCFSTAKCNAVL